MQLTLGSVLKYHEDLLSVRDEALAGLVASRAVPANAVVRHIVTFGRVLREVGVEVGPGRVADALRGLDSVELARQDDVYWTLRQTLVSRREDLESFDIAFDSWFLAAAGEPPRRRAPEPPQGERRKGGEPGPGPELDGGVAEVGGWNADELLRTKDFGAMTPEELAAREEADPGDRASRGRGGARAGCVPTRRGSSLDVRGLVRASLSTGGDPVQRAFRSRADAPRKLVLILDVSGSMDAYARAMLLYMHAARGTGRRRRGVRVRHAADAADARARLARRGDGVRRGRRARRRLVGRHADRRVAQGVQRRVGAPRAHPRRRRRDPLRRLRARRHRSSSRREMERLARQAFAVVWVNPLKGHPQYEPHAGGMRAALPHVDRFLPGHDVASLEALGTVLGGIERRHAA